MKECTFARERFQTVPPSILRGTKKYNFYGVTALLSHALPCHRPLPASLRVLTDLVNVNKVRNEPKCVLEPPRLSIAWDKRMKHHWHSFNRKVMSRIMSLESTSNRAINNFQLIVFGTYHMSEMPWKGQQQSKKDCQLQPHQPLPAAVFRQFAFIDDFICHRAQMCVCAMATIVSFAGGHALSTRDLEMRLDSSSLPFL